MIVLNKFGRRNELIQLLKDRRATVGAEIGTDRGDYAEQLCRNIPNLRLFCIDPWMEYTEGNTLHPQLAMDQMYWDVKNKLEKLDCRIIRQTSMEAVTRFIDNELDFVFIDGNHDYQHVYEDITEWTRRVKPGGVVCGHDYEEDKANNYGVIKAVDQYVKENRINPFFVMKKGTLANCWMFIKS